MSRSTVLPYMYLSDARGWECRCLKQVVTEFGPQEDNAVSVLLKTSFLKSCKQNAYLAICHLVFVIAQN